MAVIVVGKDQAHVKHVTCGNCSSVLSYVYADRKQDWNTDYTGSRDYYRYIDCACCGKQVVVR